jgi:hypothetical protein
MIKNIFEEKYFKKFIKEAYLHIKQNKKAPE